jgi:hypothetical protein
MLLSLLRLVKPPALSLFAGIMLCCPAAADTFNVSLTTSQLAGNPAGPFDVLFEFVDGSGVGDGNNTVTLSNFNFGGGTGLGSPTLFGGAGGSLETGVSLTDSSFLNIFIEQFNPGSKLDFTLDLTGNDDLGGTPDRLIFSLLENTGTPVPTLSPVSDYFLGVDLGSSGPVFDIYGSDPSRALSAGGTVSIDAPTVVPEPGSAGLVAAALVVAVIVKRRTQVICQRGTPTRSGVAHDVGLRYRARIPRSPLGK